jgi:hypothetical protein
LPSRWRNDRLWAAPESCPRLDQRSTARPPGGGLQPGFRRRRRLSTAHPLRAAASSRASEASPAALNHGLRSPARPRPGGGLFPRRRDPACPRLRSGAKLTPGLAPTLPGTASSASDRGAGNGPRKALAIDRKDFRPDLSVALRPRESGIYCPIETEYSEFLSILSKATVERT